MLQNAEDVTESTYSLTSLAKDAEGLVGPKAANLARLRGLGLPVPPAGLIAVTAYREHVDGPAIRPVLRAVLDGSGPDSLAGLRRAIVQQPLDPDLETQIRRLYELLGAGPMAVRSSAAAEDLPERSFAGQHGTYFRGDIAGCLVAVRHCWASLWSDSAYAYREYAGVSHSTAAMAVILQPLVAAECAGVAFTADPLTGTADRVVVESCFGLGEALVSGKVAPDRFVFTVPGLRLLERVVNRKELEVLVGFDGHPYQWATTPDRASAPSVSETTAREIARYALAAADGFGHPVDVEWAVEDGRTYLLQARPITTLAPREDSFVATAVSDRIPSAATGPAPSWITRAAETNGDPPPPRTATVWSNMNTGEVLPGVVTPATYSVITRVGDIITHSLFGRLGVRFGGEPIFGEFAGRIYFNVSAITEGFAAIPAFSRLDVNKLLGGMQERDDPRHPGGVAAARRPKARSTVRFLIGLPGFLAWTLSHGPGKAPGFAGRLREETSALLPPDLESAGVEELAGALDAMAASLDGLTDVLAFAGVAMAAYTNLQGLCRRWFPDEGATLPNRLVTGLGDLDSARTAVDLWRLARLADDAPSVRTALLEAAPGADPRALAAHLGAAGEPFIAAWDAFLLEHGHHARGEIELFTKRWREDPGHLLALLAGYLRAGGDTDPTARQTTNAQARLELTAALRSRLRDPIRRRLFAYVLRQAQLGSAARENLKSEAVRRLAAMRSVMLALGRRLADQGVLDTEDDVFFLTLDEIGPVARERPTQADARSDAQPGPRAQARAVAAQRRTQYGRNVLVEPPPVFVGRLSPADLTPVGRREAVHLGGGAGRGVLRGLAVSSGAVEGPARVIATVDAVDGVLPGEILVAPFTDPGWAPFLLPAAGIVMNMGGLLSHGSIIAREYGVPAVVNVGPATTTIRTGQRVRVDGDRGIVTILD